MRIEVTCRRTFTAQAEKRHQLDAIRNDKTDDLNRYVSDGDEEEDEIDDDEDDEEEYDEEADPEDEEEKVAERKSRCNLLFVDATISLVPPWPIFH